MMSAVRGINRRFLGQEVTGRGEQAPSGHIPFTPQSKKALELALQESRALGHNYIEQTHPARPLREGDGVPRKC